ncbi:MAG: hypothetical protein KA538_05900 [Azonexus sp.]|jgi:hypothetical protein|nr:hypothetical protein [Azonexus sp.]
MNPKPRSSFQVWRVPVLRIYQSIEGRQRPDYAIRFDWVAAESGLVQVMLKKKASTL